MDYAVSAIFLRNRDNVESKKHLAEIMSTSIKEAFKENVKNLSWLDEKTRRKIARKVDTMYSLIGNNCSQYSYNKKL